jgi:AcrR family transcriptional regulator
VPAEISSASSRKPRADAERNRLRLLEAARTAFTEAGTAVSLEEVARQAGVGIGTLYRHFSTRDALFAEVYRAEVQKLCGRANELADSQPPLDALRSWLLLFVDYLATKLILVEAFRSMVGDTSRLTAHSGEMLTQAITLLVDRAAECGVIAKDSVDPIDLLRALTGIATTAARPDWDKAAKRMVDLLLSGLTAR